jgi:hypothetical protein
VRSSFSTGYEHFRSNLAMRVQQAGLREAFSCTAADRPFRYPFACRVICELMGKQGMVDENRLLEEMYTRIRERMDPQILRPRHCLDL